MANKTQSSASLSVASHSLRRLFPHRSPRVCLARLLAPRSSRLAIGVRLVSDVLSFPSSRFLSVRSHIGLHHLLLVVAIFDSNSFLYWRAPWFPTHESALQIVPRCAHPEVLYPQPKFATPFQVVILASLSQDNFFFSSFGFSLIHFFTILIIVFFIIIKIFIYFLILWVFLAFRLMLCSPYNLG